MAQRNKFCQDVLTLQGISGRHIHLGLFLKTGKKKQKNCDIRELWHFSRKDLKQRTLLESAISVTTLCVFLEGGDTDPLSDPAPWKSLCSLCCWTRRLLHPPQPPPPAAPPAVLAFSTAREGRSCMPAWRSPTGTRTPAPTGPRRNTPFPANTKWDSFTPLLYFLLLLLFVLFPPLFRG